MLLSMSCMTEEHGKSVVSSPMQERSPRLGRHAALKHRGPSLIAISSHLIGVAKQLSSSFHIPGMINIAQRNRYTAYTCRSLPGTDKASV